MKGVDIHFVPFLLTHLCCICPCVLSWKHCTFLCLVKPLPVPLHLCRFSTSFPMNFVTHSLEVCQRLGTCSVIICSAWNSGSRQYPAPCNGLWRSVYRAIHFNWTSVEITRTYAQNEIKFRWICHPLQNLSWIEVPVINLSSAGTITISHSEEIHHRTTDSELNKRFAFSPEFPVFSNIYDLAEPSLSIGFHGGNCCLESWSSDPCCEIFA